jgi:hypothetical protein
MFRARRFRPAAECLETRLVLNGNMGGMAPPHYTPAELLGDLTSQAGDLYYQANQSVLSFNTVSAALTDGMRQYDIDHVSQRLNDIETNLQQAQSLTAQEHGLAQQMQQLAAQEGALKAKHPHLKDRPFRTVLIDMQNLDAQVTQVSDPALVQVDAWLNSKTK